jgi:excisionase family DNA binding protein
MSGRQQYLRAREIADLIGESVRTIRRRIADGSFPSIKVGGARLVAIEDLLRPLQSK